MKNKITPLKVQITSKKYILNGTLVRKYKQCGRNNCRCYEDKKYWHGPYWIWTRKENGKTVTKTLNKEQAVLVKRAIAEMKKVKLLIEKWKIQSFIAIEKL